MYFTHVLRSKKDNKFYIGSTKDMNKRVISHNKGHSKYTKNRGPFELVYKEEYNTLSEAKKREYHLKSLRNKIAIEKLIKNAAIV